MAVRIPRAVTSEKPFTKEGDLPTVTLLPQEIFAALNR